MSRATRRRPDGSYYSSDRAERHRQLVEDGKIGGKGSDFARAHGSLGGRRRNVRPVCLEVPVEDASDIIRAAEVAERESERLAAVAQRLGGIVA